MRNPTPTPTGWVTFQQIRLPDGRTIVVQKNDGATRSIIQPGRRSGVTVGSDR